MIELTMGEWCLRTSVDPDEIGNVEELGTYSNGRDQTMVVLKRSGFRLTVNEHYDAIMAMINKK